MFHQILQLLETVWVLWGKIVNQVFWSCSLLTPVWQEVRKVPQESFLGRHPIQTQSGWKVVMRRDLRPDIPTVDDWIDIIHDIVRMKRIPFSVRLQQHRFFWFFCLFFFEKVGEWDCVHYTSMTVVCLNCELCSVHWFTVFSFNLFSHPFL